MNNTFTYRVEWRDLDSEHDAFGEVDGSPFDDVNYVLGEIHADMDSLDLPTLQSWDDVESWSKGDGPIVHTGSGVHVTGQRIAYRLTRVVPETFADGAARVAREWLDATDYVTTWSLDVETFDADGERTDESNGAPDHAHVTAVDMGHPSNVLFIRINADLEIEDAG